MNKKQFVSANKGFVSRAFANKLIREKQSLLALLACVCVCVCVVVCGVGKRSSILRRQREVANMLTNYSMAEMPARESQVRRSTISPRSRVAPRTTQALPGGLPYGENSRPERELCSNCAQNGSKSRLTEGPRTGSRR
jgi:hypothetical protein